MHKYVVDGRELPVRIAGHSGLELCNTLAGWESPTAAHVEYLTTYDDLAVWAREAGLVDEVTSARLRRLSRRQPDAAQRVLAETHRLRADVHTIAAGGAGATALARVGAVATAARQVQALVPTGSGARWTFTRAAGLYEPLYAAGLAAVDLLTSPAVETVAACPGEGCGWLFLNPSGRRRWCIMAVCGNRAKAKAFAARRR